MPYNMILHTCFTLEAFTPQNGELANLNEYSSRKALSFILRLQDSKSFFNNSSGIKYIVIFDNYDFLGKFLFCKCFPFLMGSINAFFI